MRERAIDSFYLLSLLTSYLLSLSLELTKSAVHGRSCWKKDHNIKSGAQTTRESEAGLSVSLSPHTQSEDVNEGCDFGRERKEREPSHTVCNRELWEFTASLSLRANRVVRAEKRLFPSPPVRSSLLSLLHRRVSLFLSQFSLSFRASAFACDSTSVCVFSKSELSSRVLPPLCERAKWSFTTTRTHVRVLPDDLWNAIPIPIVTVIPQLPTLKIVIRELWTCLFRSGSALLMTVRSPMDPPRIPRNPSFDDTVSASAYMHVIFSCKCAYPRECMMLF